MTGTGTKADLDHQRQVAQRGQQIAPRLTATSTQASADVRTNADPALQQLASVKSAGVEGIRGAKPGTRRGGEKRPTRRRGHPGNDLLS